MPFFVGNWVWLAATGLAAVLLLAWRFRCLHRGPLALLPAVTDFNGNKLPPRWSCDRCGRSWPAQFDHETKPVQKFVGYDEKKAAVAAERAHVLEDQKRSIAMQRAGLSRSRGSKKRKAPVTPAEAPTHANVVPISEVRRQA